MPAYNSSPFAAHPMLLVSGWPAYLFGSWPADVSPTKMSISQVALTSDVATLTVQVIEGNIPAVGSLISVQGTQTGGGEFNVTNVALTAVSIDATTGAGTVSFALSESDVSATDDSGLAIVPQPETSEAIANGSSIVAAMPFNNPGSASQRTVQVIVEYPTLPTAAVVNLQGAESWQYDAEWVNLSSTPASTVSGGAVTGTNSQYTLVQSRFLRLNVSGVSGTGSIIGKILI